MDPDILFFESSDIDDGNNQNGEDEKKGEEDYSLTYEDEEENKLASTEQDEEIKLYIPTEIEQLGTIYKLSCLHS